MDSNLEHPVPFAVLHAAIHACLLALAMALPQPAIILRRLPKSPLT